MYNDHPWDPKIVSVVGNGSLFRDDFSNIISNRDSVIVTVVVAGRWSLFRGGHKVRFDCTLNIFFELEDLENDKH